MPINFSSCQTVSFQSPVHDVTGNYSVTNNSSTDNRTNCGNTTINNVSESHNDSSTRDNRKGILHNTMNYAVDSHVTTKGSFPGSRSPENQVIQGNIGIQQRLDTLRPKQNHLVDTYLPTSVLETVTDIQNQRASPTFSSSEDQMDVRETP